MEPMGDVLHIAFGIFITTPRMSFFLADLRSSSIRKECMGIPVVAGQKRRDVAMYHEGGSAYSSPT